MRLGAGRHAERVFLGATNVFANHVEPVQPSSERARELAVDGVPPRVVYGRAIDIVANGVGVLETDSEGAPSDWEVRLEQGVLDTVLENLSLVGLEERVTADSSESANHRAQADNAALWMARHESGPWRLLEPGGSVDACASDTHARVAEALASGNVAVVPSAALSDAAIPWRPGCWWRIDATTGETLGIGPRGWGQEVVEDLEFRVGLGMRFNQDPLAHLNASLLCFFAGVAARLVVGTAASTVGDALGESELMSVVMAMIAQAGYAGVIYSVVTLRCRLMVLTA
jgi:hypothetical protein